MVAVERVELMAVATPSSESEAVAQSSSQQGLLEKIEDFCSRPDFTESIATFSAEHAHEFATGPVEGEHPVRASLAPLRDARPRQSALTLSSTPCLQLRWHELYLQYTSLIEGQLETFLKEEGVPVAALLSAASGETDGSYTCIDYLVASTEYDAFLQLMGDFCMMGAWDADANGVVGGCLEDGSIAGADDSAALEAQE